MATTKDESDLVSHVAYGSADGTTRVIYRYRDDTTRTVEDGVEVSTGVASDTPTWWR